MSLEITQYHQDWTSKHQGSLKSNYESPYVPDVSFILRLVRVPRLLKHEKSAKNSIVPRISHRKKYASP